MTKVMPRSTRSCSFIGNARLNEQEPTLTVIAPTKAGRTYSSFVPDCATRTSRFALDVRMTRRRIRIELHHTGEIHDRLHPAKSENDSDRLHPQLSWVFVRALEVMCA